MASAAENNQLPMYIVAEVDNGRVTLDWTFAVYTDPLDALDEQFDAHAAGKTGHKVWELRPCRPLVSMPLVSEERA